MASCQSSLVSIHTRTRPRARAASRSVTTNARPMPRRRHCGRTDTRTICPRVAVDYERAGAGQCLPDFGDEEHVARRDVARGDVVEIGVEAGIEPAPVLAQSLQDQRAGRGLVGGRKGADMHGRHRSACQLRHDAAEQGVQVQQGQHDEGQGKRQKVERVAGAAGAASGAASPAEAAPVAPRSARRKPRSRISSPAAKAAVSASGHFGNPLPARMPQAASPKPKMANAAARMRPAPGLQRPLPAQAEEDGDGDQRREQIAPLVLEELGVVPDVDQQGEEDGDCQEG